MADQTQNVDPEIIPESDPELLERLHEALQEEALDKTIGHKDTWTRVERHNTALHTLEEQMKKSA